VGNVSPFLPIYPHFCPDTLESFPNKLYYYFYYKKILNYLDLILLHKQTVRKVIKASKKEKNILLDSQKKRYDVLHSFYSQFHFLIFFPFKYIQRKAEGVVQW
jgi:hypothetical protein